MSGKRKSIFDNIKRFSSAASPGLNDDGETSIDDEILQLESIDQEISKALSLIHYNIDACDAIINTRFIPLLSKYKDNAEQINNSTRFLKNLFENSLNVNIQVQKKDGGTPDQPGVAIQKDNQADDKQITEEVSTTEQLARKINVNDSESLLSESILSNGHMQIDINQLLQNFQRNHAEDNTENSAEDSTDDVQHQQAGNTPTSKREINSLFANRSKVNVTSSSIDFLNANSIIEQNTSTLTYENDLGENPSPLKIQLSPKKRTAADTQFQTPKRIKHRKSSAIIEQLNLDDSPDDIPKTPELTYLKFSPIKLKKDHGKQSVAGRQHYNKHAPPNDTEPHVSMSSLSSSTLDIPQLPTSFNLDESQNSTYQTPNQLFFNTTSSSGHPFRSPPHSLKFALPKLNLHLTRSPVKELAKRYTNDYLDMEVDDDSSIHSFDLKNKRYASSVDTSEIDSKQDNDVKSP